jgi:hypothetical protein
MEATSHSKNRIIIQTNFCSDCNSGWRSIMPVLQTVRPLKEFTVQEDEARVAQ